MKSPYTLKQLMDFLDDQKLRCKCCGCIHNAVDYDPATQKATGMYCDATVCKVKTTEQ